jgi:hypothetical protein
VPPLVARHSGLAEIAAGLEAEYPPELRDLASFDGRPPLPKLRRCSTPRERAELGAGAARRSSAGVGRASRGLLTLHLASHVGDAQR